PAGPGVDDVAVDRFSGSSLVCSPASPGTDDVAVDRFSGSPIVRSPASPGADDVAVDRFSGSPIVRSPASPGTDDVAVDRFSGASAASSGDSDDELELRMLEDNGYESSGSSSASDDDTYGWPVRGPMGNNRHRRLGSMWDSSSDSDEELELRMLEDNEYHSSGASESSDDDAFGEPTRGPTGNNRHQRAGFPVSDDVAERPVWGPMENRTNRNAGTNGMAADESDTDDGDVELMDIVLDEESDAESDAFSDFGEQVGPATELEDAPLADFSDSDDDAEPAEAMERIIQAAVDRIAAANGRARRVDRKIACFRGLFFVTTVAGRKREVTTPYPAELKGELKDNLSYVDWDMLLCWKQDPWLLKVMVDYGIEFYPPNNSMTMDDINDSVKGHHTLAWVVPEVKEVVT
ncbi:hypothetical protein GGF43_001429, partial [Coemansia sp. RSA 2618]